MGGFFYYSLLSASGVSEVDGGQFSGQCSCLWRAGDLKGEIMTHKPTFKLQ